MKSYDLTRSVKKEAKFAVSQKITFKKKSKFLLILKICNKSD